VNERRARVWAGVDAGKGHHWAAVVDVTGATLWSKKIDNDEAAILTALGEILGLADEVHWAVDISGTSSALPSGWLRRLVDERLRPALDLLHGCPGHPWGLEEPARAAVMCRTTFAERFREAAGVPPLTCLGRWRTLLAQRALRDGDARVAALAVGLGERLQHGVQTGRRRVAAALPGPRATGRHRPRSASGDA